MKAVLVMFIGTAASLLFAAFAAPHIVGFFFKSSWCGDHPWAAGNTSYAERFYHNCYPPGTNFRDVYCHDNATVSGQIPDYSCRSPEENAAWCRDYQPHIADPNWISHIHEIDFAQWRQRGCEEIYPFPVLDSK